MVRNDVEVFGNGASEDRRRKHQRHQCVQHRLARSSQHLHSPSGIPRPLRICSSTTSLMRDGSADSGQRPRCLHA